MREGEEYTDNLENAYSFPFEKGNPLNKIIHFVNRAKHGYSEIERSGKVTFFLPARTEKEFFERCEKNLKITDKETFLNIYWRGK